MTNRSSFTSDPFLPIMDSVQDRLREVMASHEALFFFLAGIPGSGKTTFANAFFQSFPTISYDRMVVPLLKTRSDPEEYVRDSNAEIVNRIEKELRTCFTRDERVIVFEDATLGLSVFRAHFLYLARLQGYKTILIYFPLNWRQAVVRNQTRSLGMTDDGQIRLPQIIVDTIHDHQNTCFQVKHAPPMTTDVSYVPYLMQQLSSTEIHTMNHAFFQMITISPESDSLISYLRAQDYSDELWTVSNDQFHVRTV